jgi:RanBP-type and C3HC4-type zinc finger-containing protein 1
VTEAELSMPNAFHCRSVDCQAWIEVDPGLTGNFQCLLCKRLNCLNCKAVHENIPCQEYKEKLQQDEWDVKTNQMMQVCS